jgi:hypothetical protein
MTGWMDAVLEWPLSVSVAALVALSALLSWLATRVVRRIWPQPAFKDNHELVGFTYAVYGLIYGVLLAFTIVVAWQRFAETEQLVMHEATLLSELWRDSVVARPVMRDDIEQSLIAYAQSVIDDEWPAMAHGRAHPQTERLYARLWALTYHFEPSTKLQEAYMGEFLARMNELSAARRLRILHSRMEIHGVLWLVLVIGAVPTVAYPLLFSSRHAWVQTAITGSILVIVTLGLLVTLALQTPFRGEVSIAPDAFREVLESFRNRLLTDPSALNPINAGP